MAWRTTGNALIPHARPLSRAEVEAFNLLHVALQNVVLLPVVVNGETRFALAVVRRNEEGLTSVILGYLALPTDKLSTVSGGELPPMSEEVHIEKKHLH